MRRVRPAPLDVDDDAPMRHDILSDDVRRVHPDLPFTNARDRMSHQHTCDRDAYASIVATFPGFTPPGGARTDLDASAPLSDGSESAPSPLTSCTKQRAA